MINILTDKNNVVIHCGAKLHKAPNGYYFKSEDMLYIPPALCNEYSVDSYPEDLEMGKYCYTEVDGFTLNPAWVEPEQSATEEDYISALNELGVNTDEEVQS